MTELQKLMENKKKYNKLPPKKMEKKGTLNIGTVETTPFEWDGKLYYFGWHRDYSEHELKGNYHIVEFETGKVVCEFADGHAFGCLHKENGKVYVIGIKGEFGGQTLDLFVSDNLKDWSKHEVFHDDSWTMYNTSICKGPDGYIMAVEIGRPVEIAGEKPYTIVFMKSKDLYNWELLDTGRHIYLKDRYAACPVIRYVGDYYYMIYLELFAVYNAMPCIVRTKDLEDWELAPLNPVMFYDENDRLVAHPERFSEDELRLIERALDTNNSDVDLCEYNGKTVITYSWGDQLGHEFLAYAEYDGTMQEFFESFF